jgi:hypothetical protein
MATNINFTVTEKTYGFTKIVDGLSVVDVSFEMTTDLKIAYMTYKNGSYQSAMIPLTPVNGVYSYTITLTGPTASYVYFEFKNSDGATLAWHTKELEMYGYFRPEIFGTAVSTVNPLTNSYDVEITYEGIFWNGTFEEVPGAGSVTGRTLRNTVLVQYDDGRGKIGTISNYSESFTGPFSGKLTFKDYDLNGTLPEIRLYILDRIKQWEDHYPQVAGQSSFDWSETDFNFNVPVEHKKPIHLSNNKGIHVYRATNVQNSYGEYIDSDELYEVLDFKSDDGLYLGYGGYTKERGTTYICGDSIIFLANQDVIFGGTNFGGLVRAMTNTYELSCLAHSTAMNGTVHALITKPSASAKLFGNNLYVRFHATVGSEYAENLLDGLDQQTGDITDVFLGRVVIEHGGKITDLEYMTAVTGQSGTTAGLQMKNIELDDDTLQFEVYICNNSEYAPSNVLTTFNIPVTLNLNAFTE